MDLLLQLRVDSCAGISITARDCVSRWLAGQFRFSMTNEIRNWAVIAAAMEQQGATDSQMYRRAKAMAEGKADPMPTSDPAAPYSISIV